MARIPEQGQDNITRHHDRTNPLSERPQPNTPSPHAVRTYLMRLAVQHGHWQLARQCRKELNA
jgi:hypothetical protein